MDTDFWHQLPSNSLIITPNQRLATFCRHSMQQRALQEKRSVWESAKIYSLSHWQQLLWQQLECHTACDLPLRLNSEQTQIVWQDIIAASQQNRLLNLPATVNAVQSAWQTLQAWQVSLADLASYQHKETQAFYHWAGQFQQYCDTQHVCDESQLLNFLIPALRDKHCDLPTHLVMLGFDEIAPQTQHFFDCLEQAGTPCQTHSFSITCQQQQRVEAPDHNTEIEWLSRWARQQLDAGKTRIGCVVPQLNACRGQLLQTFKRYCEPGSFNISSGQRFTDLPMIATAFHILQCRQPVISLTTLNHLLHSPYLVAADEEYASRAHIDADLREQAESELTLNHACKLIQASELTEHAPVFWQALQNLQSQDVPKTALPSVWARVFLNCLQQFGWPGDVALNSEEYQCLQQWHKLLMKFCQLDVVKSQWSFSEALQGLQQLMRQHLFQVQTGETPIQVLGVLEAAGLPFNALWFMGLDDQTWPAMASPNSYLPLSLQRQLGMPHASADRELAFSQRFLQRFQHSCEHLIVSHSKQHNDEIRQPSPLITDITLVEISELPLAAEYDLAQALFETRDLEYFSDETGLPVAEPSELRGGSFIFKQQAACPFSAYARFRLRAEPLASTQTGTDPLERGLVLHKALELFWQQTQDHATLCAYSTTQRQAVIERCVDKALKPLQFNRPRLFTARFTQLEQRRLLTLLESWLQFEIHRDAFSVIQQEQWSTIEIAGIPIHMRVDRIDQLQDGSQLILDYKSGKTHINAWFGDRPDEPQLPLYSLINPEVAGIVFAQVRIDAMGFKGISQVDVGIPGIKMLAELTDEAISWTEQLETWRLTLTDLAKQFLAGDARVDPKSTYQTCTYCAYANLCRIG